MKILRKKALLISLLLIAASINGQETSFYPVNPVPFNKVHLQDAFWEGRTSTNKDVTIPVAFQRSEESGRIDNFRIAAGLKEGTFPAERRGFDDSDVFKVIEGASYSLITDPDPALEAYLDTLIETIGLAQEPDGYLYTVRSIMGEGTHRDTKKPKWMAVEEGSHELYNMGHMYEAAVAHYEATGKRTFLDIAIKNANHIDSVFGPGKLELVPGHQEIELGLVKLYTATGDERYLNLAKYFLDLRGHTHERRNYNQTHKPVTEQDEAVGHAVRAIYMFAGMADIAALTGNDAYLKAMDKLWYDIVAHKLYITGGIGSPGGAEGFAQKYRLTNYTAYCETCAAVANMLWNQRMFLTHGDSKYIDIIERALYNNVLSGVSLSGDLFYYPNKLESRGNTTRQQWFHTSCCPSNITRTIPSVPGYIYAQKDKDIYVNLFISSETKINISNNEVSLKQETSVPWGGSVKLILDPKTDGEFTLKVRIPSWAKDRPVATDLYEFVDEPDSEVSININGKPYTYASQKGYAIIKRKWSAGDVVMVELPYEVRKIKSNDKVKDNIGRIALQAGPILYCTEGKEYANGKATNLMLKDAPFSFEYRKDLLNGVMTIKGQAAQLFESENGEILEKPVEFTAIPYFGWSNRGGSEMLVWLPTTPEYAAPVLHATIASKSKVSTTKEVRTGGLDAVNDLYIPGKVKSTAIPNFNFWPVKRSSEAITYEFDDTYEVSKSTVYWWSEYGEDKNYPKAWKLYYKKGKNWKPVKTKSAYPINPDGEPSEIAFEKVKTNAIKLEIEFNTSHAGLYEWEIE